MEERDIPINERLMFEFGLESGFKKRVYDRESGEQCYIKGREIVAPGGFLGKNMVEFDPINNSRMMNFFFGSYVNQLAEDGVLNGDILSYSTIPAKTPGKMKAVLKISTDEGIKDITSKPYVNETSCYADLVCRINGDEEVDMTPYDIDRRRTPLKKQSTLRKEADKKQKKERKERQNG